MLTGLLAVCLTGCGGAEPDRPAAVSDSAAAARPAAEARPASTLEAGSAAEAAPPSESVPDRLIAGPGRNTTPGPAADSPSGSGSPDETAPRGEAPEPPAEPQPTKLPADLLDARRVTPLNEQNSVLVDLPGRRVYVKTRVCLTQGQLEMLLCTAQTKEHESILTFDGQAQTIHAALLAMGLTEGTPSRYDADTGIWHPATGRTVSLFVHWVDPDGTLHRASAKSWIRHSRYRYYEAPFETLPADLTLDPDGALRYDEQNRLLFWHGPMSTAQRDACLKLSRDEKFQAAIRRFHDDSQPREMEADWIFVGSGFFKDEDGTERYLAEGGYVVCVANFSMAMIDLSVESSSSGMENLSFEAWTERIPPRGSEVLLEIVPEPDPPGKSDPPAKPGPPETSGPPETFGTTETSGADARDGTAPSTGSPRPDSEVRE